jgi:hypothetical protein
MKEWLLHQGLVLNHAARTALQALIVKPGHAVSSGCSSWCFRAKLRYAVEGSRWLRKKLMGHVMLVSCAAWAIC